MISKQIDTCRRTTPVPLSFLIKAANSFDCDIYIECDDSQVNVKNYDEMICNLSPRNKSTLFFFSGADELAAKRRFERIFQE